MRLTKPLFLFITLCSFNVFSQSPSEMNPVAKQLAEKHQALLPIVSVANVYVGCQLEKSDSFAAFNHQQLLNDKNTDELATMTLACLDGVALKEEKAIDYGIVGCFTSQFSELEPARFEEKMTQVTTLLEVLSLEQKKESLTKCVNDQTLQLL